MERESKKNGNGWSSRKSLLVKDTGDQTSGRSSGGIGELSARTSDRRHLDELAGKALPILEMSTSLCTVGLVGLFSL